MNVRNLDPLLNVNTQAIETLNKILFDRFHGVVQTGPMCGMKIEDRFEWDDKINISTKLIGCYEHELNDVIHKAVARKPDTVINAGCAEGYYAIGLKRLLPNAKVYAMDINAKCLDHCCLNAMANGIFDMVLVHGKVGAKDLSRGEGRKLYVVDIEGYEWSVLDPIECPDLLTSDIIVECHDFLVVDGDDDSNTSIVTDELKKRFELTHDVEVILPQVQRPPCEFPFLHDLSFGFLIMAILDLRPSQTAWLACWAKQGENDG